MDRRLRYELQALLALPRELGGLVREEGDEAAAAAAGGGGRRGGGGGAPEGDDGEGGAELPQRFQLEVRPAADLCLTRPCRFDVELDPNEFPGMPPAVRCATSPDLLPQLPHLQRLLPTCCLTVSRVLLCLA